MKRCLLLIAATAAALAVSAVIGVLADALHLMPLALPFYRNSTENRRAAPVSEHQTRP